MNSNQRKLLTPADASRYLLERYGMHASNKRVSQWMRLGHIPPVLSREAPWRYRYTTEAQVDRAVERGRIPPQRGGRRATNVQRDAVAVELMDEFGLERVE